MSAGEWTSFDPHLRSDTYPNEAGHRVVVTHLPTGMQETCAQYGTVLENRACAIAKLRLRVVGQ